MDSQKMCCFLLMTFDILKKIEDLLVNKFVFFIYL